MHVTPHLFALLVPNMKPHFQAFKSVRLSALFTGKITRTGTVALFVLLTMTASSMADQFDTLRITWANTLISSGTSSSSTSSINTKAANYQASMITSGTMTTATSGYLWSDLVLERNYTQGDSSLAANNSSGNIVSTYGRLQSMALAYATPGCALYGDATLAAAAVSGLDWMNAHFYTNTNYEYGNWFDWEMSGAKNLLNTLTLIYPALTSTKIANYIKAYYNFGPDSTNAAPYFVWNALTGANTSTAALNMSIAGIVLGSGSTSVVQYQNGGTTITTTGSALLTEANTKLNADPTLFGFVTSGDGFYADGSYVYHGVYAYTGSYGLTQLENVITFVNLFQGSSWAITNPDLPNVYSWVTNSFEPVIYNGAIMDMVRGRQIASSSSDEFSVGAKAIADIQNVALFTSGTTPWSSLTAFANSPRLASGQFHFYNMDRVVALRSGFGFGLSMSSTRIAGYEINTTSPTNLKGWYTGSGMTYLYVGNTDTQFTGDFWATVDWYHLPGTTTEVNTTTLDQVTDQSWAGGAQVANSYGVAGMYEHPAGTNLYAKKSWFMLDNEIVCLGAGITDASGTNTKEIDTTVEDRRMGTSGSNNFYVNGTKYPVISGTAGNSGSSFTITTGTWCALDGVGGYYFPSAPTNLQATFVSGTGLWTTINPSDSNSTLQTDYYLKLYFNHGTNPTGASTTYSYVLLPGMSSTNVSAYAANPDISVISNTAAIQAVKSQTLGVVGANFWATNGGSADLIVVNKASSVITLETGTSISVGISDPTQANTAILTGTLNRAAIATLSTDAGVTVTGTSPKITFTVDLSQSQGKTLQASFQLAPKPSITGNLSFYALKGSSLSYQITTANGATSYDASGLPPGTSVNIGGLISGTLTQPGTYFTTISAANTSGTSYATLTTYVLSAPADLSYTFNTSGTSTWTCPSYVGAVKVECWGGGGAGGSASRTPAGGSVQYGGGGAGGAYAKLSTYQVAPGNSYYMNVGAGGANSSSITGTTVSGSDSWFNDTNSPSSVILAKGGSGGASAIGNTSTTRYGTGGTGTASGSIGDSTKRGGGGVAGSANGGGGGGSSAGTGIDGVDATVASSTGATAPSGGGNGGTGTLSTGGSNPGGSGYNPGGGGGGARDSSGITQSGGNGAAGQVVLTAAKLWSTITLSGTGTFTYDGNAKTVTATANPTTSGTLSIIYSGTTTPPSGVGYYTVVATIINDTNYAGSATGTLAIVAQTINDWRQYYFNTTSTSGNYADAADYDGDGLTNYQEYVFGSDPKTKNTTIFLTQTLAGGTITLTFVAKQATGSGYAGITRHYAVESTTDLTGTVTWTALPGYPDIVATGQNVTVTQSATGAKRFYRLKAWLQ